MLNDNLNSQTKMSSGRNAQAERDLVQMQRFTLKRQKAAQKSLAAARAIRKFEGADTAYMSDSQNDRGRNMGDLVGVGRVVIGPRRIRTQTG